MSGIKTDCGEDCGIVQTVSVLGCNMHLLNGGDLPILIQITPFGVQVFLGQIICFVFLSGFHL